MGSEVVEGKPWVRGFLLKRKIPFQFVEHKAVTKPVDSAIVRGVKLQQIAKALLYLADGKPLLAILPGNREVNELKLRKAINAKRVRLAAPIEVKKYTGCSVGLVPPTIAGIRKVVDKSLHESEEVSFNAGIATAGIVIKLRDLLKVLDNSDEADISFGRTVIGLECHIQLATESKLFCSCKTQAEEPNGACCPICLGHPGSKPVLNAKALEYALRVALALNCSVNEEFFFSRKTYFYPDMPKNFQITQYEVPIGLNGFINLSSGKKIRIKRVHLEEDPAALVHEAGIAESKYCLVDYNRSGIPLVEVVTEPDLSSPQEARDFLDQLTTILSYLQVYSPATGTLKADANVSVYGHAMVEIKNVTGKKGVEKALGFEIARQRNLLLQEKEVVRETRAFDEKTMTTKSIRVKEVEEDYGYIFEPDLTAIQLSKEEIERFRKRLPEFHATKAKRFQQQFKLDEYTAKVLASNFALSNLFEETAKQVNAKAAAKFLIRELLAIVNRNNLDLSKLRLDAGEITALLQLLLNGKITEKNAKEAMICYVVKGTKPVEFIEKHQLGKDLDAVKIEKVVAQVLDANRQAVADLKAGKKKALHFLVGQVIRLTKAKAEPRIVQKIIERKIRGKAN